MKHKNIFFISCFFILFFTRTQSVIAEEISIYPTLVMHGETYQNTCSPTEMSKLTNNLRKNNISDYKTLKIVLETILCADENIKNTKKIYDALDKEIIESYEGTGEQKSKTLKAKRKEIVSEIMARRNAWNAEFDVNHHEIKLQYFSNEACVNSVSLRYVKQKWMIFKVGGACD